mgnify:CR=1 FL=1
MFDVIFQDKSGRRKSLEFDGLRCAIGSDRKNDLILKDRRVEKFHAAITFKDGCCLLSDLGSRTGTFVNSEKLTGDSAISELDEITIGNTLVWVHIDHASQKQYGSGYSQPLMVRSVVNTDRRNDRINTANKGGLSEENRNVGKQPESAIQQSFDEATVDDILGAQSITSDSQLLHWGHVVHERLLQQMDLRRKDIHRMSDQQLRTETEALINEILASLQDTLPDEVDVEQIKISVLNEAIGLGPLEKFLSDDSITEIMVNNYAEVFVERDGKLVRSQYGFSSDQAVLSVIERIITPIGRRIDESSPMVDARLKDGSRVNAVVAPLALKGPSLTIRKFAKKRLQFEDLVGYSSVSQEMVDFLRVCVESRKNIVVSGGTGSGKTTLLNVLSGFIPDTDRIVTVEDAAELQLDQPNLVALEAKPANIEGRGEVSIRELVKNTLRMRPDRIVVGECRGGEALDMLQAMNTGHDGCLTTAHANAPRDLISRLEVMVLMSGMALPVTAIREQIASAVDIVVQQTRFPCGTRKISRITEVVGIESGTVQLQDIFHFERKGYAENGKVIGEFKPVGFIPTFYEELAEVGTTLDLAIFKNPGAAAYERY